jgi:hypothetical protein
MVVIGVNVMAGTGMINGETTAQISEKYNNLFVPAGFTFSIWGLIYLTLLGFIIYQLRMAFIRGHEETLEQLMVRMRGWWLISCMANSCWLFAWHYELMPLAILLMLALLVSLLAIHLNFNIAMPGASWSIRFFIYLPFSLYLGWICVAMVANIAALLVYTGWDGLSVPVTIILILTATLAATLLVVRRNNLIAGLVAAWALLGIIARQENEGGPMALVVCCLISMAILLFLGLWQLNRQKQ